MEKRGDTPSESRLSMMGPGLGGAATGEEGRAPRRSLKLEPVWFIHELDVGVRSQDEFKVVT